MPERPHEFATTPRAQHPSASPWSACPAFSARRYLEYFAASGRVKVRLKYGAAGRPERRYGWRSS
jgi:response regulator of citrate/malate metabolism